MLREITRTLTMSIAPQAHVHIQAHVIVRCKPQALTQPLAQLGVAARPLRPSLLPIQPTPAGCVQDNESITAPLPDAGTSHVHSDRLRTRNQVGRLRQVGISQKPIMANELAYPTR